MANIDTAFKKEKMNQFMIFFESPYLKSFFKLSEHSLI